MHPYSTSPRIPARLVVPLASSLLMTSTVFAAPPPRDLSGPSLQHGATLVAQASAAPKKCRPRRGKFHFQFEEAGIYDVLRQISVITCKNFIVSEGVKGKKDLTIISRNPVTVDQAYSAFLSALEANNMALVRAGKYYKVIERKAAAKAALPMLEKKADGSVGPVDLPNALSYHDDHITFLHELKYTSKEQVQPLLKNLMTKSGDLQFVGTNLLIITDAAANIRRIVSIVDRIDVSGAGNRIHVVSIEYAEANQISSKLQEIFGQSSVRGGGKKSKNAPVPKRAKGDDAAAASDDDNFEDVSLEKIIADERTNKLIIISSKKAFEHIKELIAILDVPGDTLTSGTQVWVHPLHNADAQKTASTLSSVAQGQSKKKGKGKKKKADEPATLFEGEVKVSADEATNALVIIASARDYRALKSVINELDVRRPQVYVEAAILEVALSEDRQFGLNAFSGLPITVPGFENKALAVVGNEGGQSLVTSAATLLATQQIVGQAAANQTNITATEATAAAQALGNVQDLLGWATLLGPEAPGSQEAFGSAIPSFGMVLNAIQNNANVDVLSTPHIMTTDNETAQISVGEKVPVVKGIQGLGGGGGFGFGGLQQVGHEDVKIDFKVTPHVNDEDDIRLELEQEVSGLGENVPVGNGLTQPIITSRTAKTTVVIRDQQTMVIGGLISTRKTDSERKFPILGEIPVIGWLVKQWDTDEAKSNLLIVLTPYVVRGRDDFRKIYDRKMRERREFIEAFYGQAREYNPYIDYDKKSGPLAALVQSLDHELLKVENGGPGLPGEVSITPEQDIQPFDEDALSDPAPDESAATPATDATPAAADATPDATGGDAS